MFVGPVSGGGSSSDPTKVLKAGDTMSGSLFFDNGIGLDCVDGVEHVHYGGSLGNKVVWFGQFDGFDNQSLVRLNINAQRLDLNVQSNQPIVAVLSTYLNDAAAAAAGLPVGAFYIDSSTLYVRCRIS
jgi:hypothetical protein